MSYVIQVSRLLLSVGFRAIYLGLFFNCVIMASVNLAAAKIANVILGWPMSKTLIICSIINVIFAATAGLWGVLVVDLIQFGIAMTGAFATAIFALKQPEIGGLTGLSRSWKSSTRRRLTFSPISVTGLWPYPSSLFLSSSNGGQSGIREQSPEVVVILPRECWQLKVKKMLCQEHSFLILFIMP